MGRLAGFVSRTPKLNHQQHAGEKCNGIVNVEYEDSSDNVRGELVNGIFDGRVLRITYRNENSHIIQHGSIYIELQPDGVTMEDGFLGYGYKSKRVVFGEVQLTKGA